jgi:hypothetical protein
LKKLEKGPGLETIACLVEVKRLGICQIFDVVKRISFVSSIVTGVQDYPDD